MTWSLLCPECHQITHREDWLDGGSLHWTDAFGAKQCPICHKSTAEDLLYCKGISEITIQKKDYKEYTLRYEIQNLEKALILKKEHLERILQSKKQLECES